MTPSPPHADMNAKKAVVVFWKDHPERFVFSHEASYCPILELPSGAAMCNQFFEGNLGDAELFNNMGRKEKNSFVDVIQSGPERVWVRWTYFCVNMNDDSKPRLRGTEDYFAYPNGLVLRRMTYESLMPNDDRRLQHAAGRTVRRGAGRLARQGPVPRATRSTATTTSRRARPVQRPAIRHLLGRKRQGPPPRRRRHAGGDLAVAGLCPGAAVSRAAALRRARRGQRLPGGEEPVDRSLHAGGRRRLRLGRRALGPLADRLAELADVVLETGLALRLQFRIGRPVLRPGRETDQDRSGRTIRNSARTWTSTAGRRAGCSTCCSVRPGIGTKSAASAEVGSTRASMRQAGEHQKPAIMTRHTAAETAGRFLTPSNP